MPYNPNLSPPSATQATAGSNPRFSGRKPAFKTPTAADLMLIDGDPTKTIEQQRMTEARASRGGFLTLGKLNNSLAAGLTAPPGLADDPALLAAKAREMQMRRMNRGRGGTVLTGNGSIKLG